jgi:tRNA 2-thiocytidine biosynthesis protein TtcA
LRGQGLNDAGIIEGPTVKCGQTDMNVHDPNGAGDAAGFTDAESGGHSLFADAPQSVEFRKLRKRLVRKAREAIDGFNMLERAPAGKGGERPRWLIGLSGGKDSYGLLAVLLDLKWRGLLPVDLLACNLDQGQPNFPKHILPEFLDRHGIEHRIEYEDTYSIVTDKIPEGRTYCSLCSRLRRGNLYRIAREEGCDALVLGHHREDALETFFMNLFHGGRLAAMPPKLVNDEGDLLVLRPLVFAAESDLERFARDMEFPIIPCDLCGSQEGLQRDAMKRMLNEMESRTPGRKDTMIRALTNVRPSHLLDSNLFDFQNLTR